MTAQHIEKAEVFVARLARCVAREGLPVEGEEHWSTSSRCEVEQTQLPTYNTKKDGKPVWRRNLNSTSEPSNVNEGKSDPKQSPDTWLLEDVFPDAGSLLSPSQPLSAADNEVLVVLDTNALMLPLNLSKQKLPEIENAYRKLLEQERLFVPARVIREFIKNRDGKLAALAKALQDRASAVGGAKVEIPPLLEGLEQTGKVAAAADGLNNSRAAYLDAINILVDQIRSWRGDDPITSIYHRIFATSVIVDVDEDRKQIEDDWKTRLKRKIPPGYKDGSKADKGIGDYLVWLVILKLGRDLGKNLIFVTGEEKADWFVRADGERIYPRLELIDEYRRASKGKHLHLATLADVLLQMKVSKEVVQEVRTAELVANTAIQAAAAGHPRTLVSDSADTVSFDYSTNDGEIVIGSGTAAVPLKFSRASDISIRLLRCTGTPLIARAKNVAPGEAIAFDQFDSSSRQYLIQLGEVFLARNENGFILAGRIENIADDSRGAPRDDVRFRFRIFTPGEGIVAP